MRELLEKYFPFWNKLTEEEKSMLATSSSIVDYKEGEHLFSTIDNCLGVVITLQGKLRVYMMSDEGKEINLFNVDQDEICLLTANCVIHQINFDCHVDAQVNSKVLIVSSMAFGKIKEKNMFVENFAYKLLASSFSEVMWAIQQVLFSSIDKRIASYLYDRMLDEGDTIKATHENIAVAIGSVREVVTRVLKIYADKEIVELGRGKIKILSKEKLKKCL